MSFVSGINSHFVAVPAFRTAWVSGRGTGRDGVYGHAGG